VDQEDRFSAGKAPEANWGFQPPDPGELEVGIPETRGIASENKVTPS
jgi:hypothetical protein